MSSKQITALILSSDLSGQTTSHLTLNISNMKSLLCSSVKSLQEKNFNRVTITGQLVRIFGNINIF